MRRTPGSRSVAFGFIAAAMMFFGVQHASAARIYNFTNHPIDVSLPSKGQNRTVTLKPGEKSDSLEWKVALPFSVWHPFGYANGYPVCKFDVNTSEIVGGNYLLVVQQGDTISCTLCDAGRKIRFKRSGKVKTGYEYTTPDHKPNSCE
jgi:hypothetical protein